MGLALSTRFEWATQPTSDGNALQLKTSVVNQDLLYDLMRIVDQLCRTHPNEAKAEFRRPIQWSTALRPSLFSGDKWNVQASGQKLEI